MNVSNIQLLLIVFGEIIFERVGCDRMDSSRMDTRVVINVTYLIRQYNDKSSFSHTKPLHKIISVNYDIPHLPKSGNPDIRSSNRQASNNNIRHGFRFSNIEKGGGTLTMSSYENDNSESGLRQRHVEYSGKLIHIVSVPDQPMGSGGNYSGSPLCHNACLDPMNSVHGTWIALVQNGVCSVQKKVSQIMKLPNHPASIIIYGSSDVNVKQESYLTINQDDSPMTIILPWSKIQDVVQTCYNSSGQIALRTDLISKFNRSTLERHFSNQNQCNITIKVFSTSDDNFLNRTSVLFVSISFILLMVISLAWLMFYYVQRFRYIHTKEQFSRRLAHMAKKAVAKIPVKTIRPGDKETDAEMDNCAICIECYKPSDTVRILPCKHYFHKSCIDPWLLEQRSCPMCKLNILHAYGFLPNERGSMISEDRLSELDSSLELQFLPGSVMSPAYLGASTVIQAQCQARECAEPPALTPTTTINSATITLPPIFTHRPSQANHNRWMSLRLKRPQRSSYHHIDRCVSLRHLCGGNTEERTTFLPQRRPLSQSATSAGLHLGLVTYAQPWPQSSASSSSTSDSCPAHALPMLDSGTHSHVSLH